MSKKQEVDQEEVEAVKLPGSDQVPLALANLVSQGVPLKDAKKRLGIK